MYPRQFSLFSPEKPAVVMAESGESMSYRELEARANQGAHFLRALGLKKGDVVALLLENNARYFGIYWATQRSGIYIVPISTRLTVSEAAYIIRDSGARVLVLSSAGGEGEAAIELSHQ